MSETKTYVFPESNGGNSGSGMLGLIAPLLQQRGIDPNLLLTMTRNGGFGGEGGWFIWVIFLFFLMGWGGNGWGYGGRGNGTGAIENQINNDYGRDLLLQAINGNRSAIDTLASTLNCSVGQIQSAICQLGTQLQGVGNQVGMSSQQIINAVQSGNCSIAQAVADCCCKTQNAITSMGYDNQLAICNQTNNLVNTMNSNTLSLRDGATANTNAILARLDAMQNQTLLDKIDALREKNSVLEGEISQRNQTSAIQIAQAQSVAPINAALSDLSARLGKIECTLPPSVSVPYSPIVGVPTCVAAQYGYPFGFGANNGLWG